MTYLHCPTCERAARLDSTAEPPLRCRHCDSPLAPMTAHLTAAVLARFERDMQGDAARPRFVRG